VCGWNGCLMNSIANGICNEECNNAWCVYDGGDCSKLKLFIFAFLAKNILSFLLHARTYSYIYLFLKLA
jgi:hypothetical protein